jgi:hypothetical protein
MWGGVPPTPVEMTAPTLRSFFPFFPYCLRSIASFLDFILDPRLLCLVLLLAEGLALAFPLLHAWLAAAELPPLAVLGDGGLVPLFQPPDQTPNTSRSLRVFPSQLFSPARPPRSS